MLMFRQYLNFSFLLLFLTIYSIAAYTQDYDSLTQKYAGEYGVIAEYSEHLVIEFDKSGRLTASARTIKDILILDDNYRSFFTTGSVYHSYFNELTELNAATLVPAKRGYTTIKTQQKRTIPSPGESVFYDDAKETEVTFTNLVKGAVTHLESKVSYRDIRLLPRVYFKSYLPIAHATLQVTYPKGVDIQAVLKGAEDAGFITKHVEESRKTTTVTWQASNVPKATFYADAPSPNYYLPHIVLFVKSYVDPSNNQKTPVLGTVADLNRFCNEFVKDLKTADAKDIVNAAATITKDAATNKQKAAMIYNWVQKNVKYIAYEDSLGGFIPREPAIVLQRKFGDCKDMAALLRALCRACGLEAHYVWIGTRKLPYRYEDTPLPLVFNHMIAAVKLDGQWVFMDGTDPILPFGTIPYPLQGKEGLIGKGAQDFEVVIMPESEANLNQTIDTSYVFINNGILSGDISIHLKGFPAWDMASLMMYQTGKEREKAVNAITQRGSNKYTQKSFKYHPFDDVSKDINIQAGFEIKDYFKKAGAEYFINLNLTRSYGGSWIDIKERKAPLEIDYKQTVNQVVILTIPEGYKVSYVPGNKSGSIKDILSYSINYLTAGNKVILSKKIIVDTEMLAADQFNEFNKMITELQNCYKESIVLSPI